MSTSPVTITRSVDLPCNDLASLVAESEQEGWQFVRRLVDDFESGMNRFDRPGEALFLARDQDAVVGVCGLNVDPYIAEPSVGRVRRLYVLSSYRGRGIARQLVQAVVTHAQDWFQTLRVRTDNPDAARLYERLGFQPAPGLADCTHVLLLDDKLAYLRS